MTGTEKQIAYAQDIINRAYGFCDTAIAKSQAEIAEYGSKSGLLAELVTFMTMRKQLEGSFSACESASKIIERKETVSGSAILAMAERMKSQLRKMDDIKRAELIKSVTGYEADAK
jgi:hypothetical protein